MTRTPTIVTFANQKGGVGKTTLCVAFANHLVAKGARVAVADCDFQQSIVKRRKADMRKYGEGHLPYDVLSCAANDKEATAGLIGKLRNDKGIDVALLDAPGSLTADGLVPMCANSDFIAVPFHYDLATVPSTAGFLLFIDRLRKALGGRMGARLFIIPNLHDGRVGKRSELLLWEETREAFSRYGQVTARIPRRADMERVSTMAALDMQASITAPAFDALYTAIFGTTEPIGPSPLSGIQLAENLKEGKGKDGNDNKGKP